MCDASFIVYSVCLLFRVAALVLTGKWAGATGGGENEGPQQTGCIYYTAGLGESSVKAPRDSFKTANVPARTAPT